jgi:hypothetical protein
MNELQMHARVWDGDEEWGPVLAGTRGSARSFEVHVAPFKTGKVMTRYMLAGGLAAAAAAAGVIVAAATSERGPPVADEHTSVEAPGARIKTSDGTTRVEAPFTTVEKNGDNVRVRAPFVDIEVPKTREPDDR